MRRIVFCLFTGLFLVGCPSPSPRSPVLDETGSDHALKEGSSSTKNPTEGQSSRSNRPRYEGSYSR